MNICFKCHTTEQLLNYDSKRSNKRYICRECNRLKCLKYRNSAGGKIRVDISKNRQRKILNREKHLARRAIEYAVKHKKIIKPDSCSICLAVKEHVKDIQGHHSDYSKPLDVVWVCRNCHTELHKNTLYDNNKNVNI